MLLPCMAVLPFTQLSNLEAIKLLVDAGADVNSGGPKGHPLVLAALRGAHQLARLLISKGADVGERWTGGNTALQIAAARNHVKVVEELLASGADVSAVNALGETALHCAAAKGHGEVVQLLLAKGVRVDAQTVDGTTALIAAAWQGHAEIVKLLLASGANMRISKISSRYTPLHAAADAGHAETAALLLSAGANPNPRDAYGRTAMHAAARHGHVAVVQQLLTVGADWSIIDKFGKTALMAASSKAYMEVVELLVRATGANLQQELLGAAQAAAQRQQWNVWAFLVRSIHSRYGDAVEQCLYGVNMAAAMKALASGWQGEVDRHGEVLEAARKEREEAEEAKGQAQQLLIQTALLQKQLERSRPERQQ